MNKFIIPLWMTPPSHQAGIGIKTDRFGRAMSYKTSRLAAFQQQFAMLLRSEINKQKFKRIEGDYSLSIIFYLANRKHGDIDNLAKSVSDALEGQLFNNDRDCKEMFLYILYDKNPRIVLEISPYEV